MKATIELTGSVELTFDENDPLVIQALEDYRASMDKDATIDELLQHVAFYVIRFGDDRMVEGVGYVGFNGRIPNKPNYSGIMVSDGYDNFEFEVTEKL